ncbi:hypothetical protein A4R44_02952 [Amycolatopsis sp. M39]|nr:hypothetical protein A4R44_02952 [Amycolatopsis sp. M39]
MTQVPVDTDDLGSVLAGHGWRPRGRTVFLWEGVTQYLAEAAVRATFDALATAGARSTLLSTFVPRRHGDVRRAEAVPAVCGQAAAAVALRAVSRSGRRYVVPTGRALPVPEIGRCVEAGKA